jgi:hypothetical protein
MSHNSLGAFLMTHCKLCLFVNKTTGGFTERGLDELPEDDQLRALGEKVSAASHTP